MKPTTRKALLAVCCSTLLLSQSACLSTRAMMRDNQGFDIDPPSAQGGRNAQAESHLVDELKAEITRLSGRIEELERTKAEAEKNSASTAPQLKAHEDRIAELEKTQLAMLEVIKGQKNAANAAAPTAAAGTGAEAPAQGGALERAKSLYQAGKFDAAVEGFSQFLASNPKKGPATEEALQLLGESFFLMKQYQSAIVEYSKIQERFPKSKRVPGALLRIAQSFEAMGFEDDARGFYQELMDRYPKSPEAKKAQERKSTGKAKSKKDKH
jgi:tol-pal system protein YbgF